MSFQFKLIKPPLYYDLTQSMFVDALRHISLAGQFPKSVVILSQEPVHPRQVEELKAAGLANNLDNVRLLWVPELQERDAWIVLCGDVIFASEGA